MPNPAGDVRPPEVQADEKTTLLTFLNYLRNVLVRKVDGLSDADARRPGVSSGTSLLWLIKHLTATEQNWLLWAYAGGDEYWDDELPVTEDDTVESLIAAYRAAGAQVDEVVADCVDLDVPGVRSVRETAPPTMRWILVHLIEETARHAGHADILREQLDGATGR